MFLDIIRETVKRVCPNAVVLNYTSVSNARKKLSAVDV